MRTVVLGPPPPKLAELIADRRASGADLYDEVWEGEYHLSPAPHSSHGRVAADVVAHLRSLAKRAGLYECMPFNLGEPDDYRVPDYGWLRTGTTANWIRSAAILLEVISPDDETWAKLPFYAAHGVQEVLIVDPRARSLTWLELQGDIYEPIERSLLGITPDELAAQIDWPPLDE